MNMKVKVRTKQEYEAQQFRFKPRTFKIDSIIESDTSSPVGSLPNETQSEWQEWLSEEVIAGKKSEEEDDALEEWNSMQDSMNNMVHVHNQLFGSMDLVQTKILDVIEMILAIPLSTPLAKRLLLVRLCFGLWHRMSTFNSARRFLEGSGISVDFSMLRRRKLSKFLNSRKRLLKAQALGTAQALEMVESMKNVAKLDVELTEEGKKPVCGYKNVIGARRASWRIMSSIEQKEESKGNDHNVKIIKGYCQKVEEELSKICNDILTIIDKHVIPSFKSGEATVFYYKMKGDYCRYIAEFKSDQEKKEAAE
ncbi:hypothetical protein RHGRI_033733 [Rhododendron griersonianum]|uniref:14-3-3 domain-containing protein n=1 Tax=Rhododendron griersonianum TaxID=479676 RepID=A0AAV6I147_9ERIC|nr:hypothetical protein RHGRI_033733 [Rhododendron griersonianum]